MVHLNSLPLTILSALSLSTESYQSNCEPSHDASSLANTAATSSTAVVGRADSPYDSVVNNRNWTNYFNLKDGYVKDSLEKQLSSTNNFGI